MKKDKIQDVLHYRNLLSDSVGYSSEDESQASLIERKEICTSCITRIRAALKGFVRQNYRIDFDSDYDEETESALKATNYGKAQEKLFEAYSILYTCSDDENELKKNLESAKETLTGLSALINALEAGDDDEIMTRFISEDTTLSQYVDIFSEAIERHPQSALLYAGLARAYTVFDNHHNAINHYKQALEKDYNPQYLFENGKVWFMLENWENALDYFRKAKEINEENNLDELCKYERLTAEKIQASDNKTDEERMGVYLEMIEKLKKNPSLSIEELAPKQEEKANLAATMAYNEEYELLERYCAEGHSLNLHCSVDFRFWQPTPLFWACKINAAKHMQDPCKMLRFLVEHGADPNMPSAEGSTPLWNQCTQNGNFEILKCLLDLGANPNQESCSDNELNFYPLTEALLPIVDETGENFSCFDDSAIKKALILLLYGADANICSDILPDYTPLMLAVSYGEGKENVNLVKRLIEKGADLNAKLNDTGNTVLMQTIENIPYETDYQKETALELIELLINSGTELNTFDNYLENTPLILAYKYDKFEIGELLMLHGADLAALEEYRNPKNPIKKQIRNLRDKAIGGLFALPASDEEIAACKEELDEIGSPLLPDDYVQFLKICNGLAWNGIELHGTNRVEDDDSTDYSLDDIVSADMYYRELYGDLGAEYLYFGRADEEYYTFDSANSKYEARDRTGNDIMEEHESFEKFFLSIMNIKTETESTEWTALRATVDSYFRPGAGNSSSETREWSREELLNPEKGFVDFNYFRVFPSEISPNSLHVKLDFKFDYLHLDNLGNCELNENKSGFQTDFLNIAYDTHMRIGLELLPFSSQRKEFSTTEGDHELDDIIQKMRAAEAFEAPFLAELPQELVQAYEKFGIETEFGVFLRINSEMPLHSMMIFFGLFQEAFKGITIPEKTFDSLIERIKTMDSSLKEKEIMIVNKASRHYAYNKLLLALSIPIDEEKGDVRELFEIFDIFAETELLYRANFGKYGDVEFVGVAACLYMMADIYRSIGGEQNEDAARKAIKEAKSIYFNLSEREDLFNPDQQAVLKLLNRLVNNF